MIKVDWKKNILEIINPEFIRSDNTVVPKLYLKFKLPKDGEFCLVGGTNEKKKNMDLYLRLDGYTDKVLMPVNEMSKFRRRFLKRYTTDIFQVFKIENLN